MICKVYINSTNREIEKGLGLYVVGKIKKTWIETETRLDKNKEPFLFDVNKYEVEILNDHKVDNVMDYDKLVESRNVTFLNKVKPSNTRQRYLDKSNFISDLRLMEISSENRKS